ncbi:MAG: flagellar hook-basal body complex protein [Planctomycetota bacterium]|nr:flagellar hook-basal body complex protein [Planctomycetota bacterium]
MNYGLYLAASGVLTNSFRQDVFANNLANVETVGFKPDLATLRQRDPASTETMAGPDVSRALLDRLGGGVLAAPTQTSFAPGQLRPTGNLLDVALDTPDTFLAVEAPPAAKGSPAGDSAGSKVRLTRDGRLSRNAQGYLITASGGRRVLDKSDKPILLPGTGPAGIDAEGRVIQDGEVAGQLQVTSVTDTTKLRKAGGNLFTWDGKKDLRKPASSALVRPGFVESSGVDPIRALMDVVGATQSVSASANLIHYHDQIMDRAVNTLSRVA